MPTTSENLTLVYCKNLLLFDFPSKLIDLDPPLAPLVAPIIPAKNMYNINNPNIDLDVPKKLDCYLRLL